jgi:glycosyltransferase involved in cell wall biosynthesis
MLGRFSAEMDNPGLLLALAGMPRGSWVLDVAGDGPDQARIAALAEELGIAPYVLVLGPRADVAGLLQQSDISALISHWEGLPYSILEAMSAGRPVIASDVGGVREAVLDGVSGILVPRGDGAALRTALAGLIGDPARRERLGAAGRRRYETAFRFEIMLAKTIALYERVAATGAPVEERSRQRS